MKSRDPTETLYRVIGAIYRHVDDLVVLEYPRRLSRRSIDVVVKLGDGRIAFLKVTDDTGNLSKYDVQELRDIASTLNAGALIVANYMNNREIVDDVAYELHGVKVVNVNTLEGVFSGETQIYVYQSGDTFKVRIDGETLRRRRLEEGLSLGDVAYRIGVTRRTVYEYERGYIEPSLDKAEKLVQLLGEEILVPVDLFECPPGRKRELMELNLDSEEEKTLARKLYDRNFNVVHAKRTTVDLVGAKTKRRILLVISHGRESFESLKLKSLNSRKLARLTNSENYIVVDSREVKRELEKEELEVYNMSEFEELIEAQWES